MLFIQIFCHYQFLTKTDGFSRFFDGFLFWTGQSSKAPRTKFAPRKNWTKPTKGNKNVGFFVNHYLLTHFSFHCQSQVLSDVTTCYWVNFPVRINSSKTKIITIQFLVLMFQRRLLMCMVMRIGP